MSAKSLRLQFPLLVEALEPRNLPSSYQPTAQEQLFLEQLNDARGNPAAYGASIGLDLSTVAPSEPLAFDTRLVSAARDHSQDMNDRAYFEHDTPEGLDPGDRMAAAGYPTFGWAESIAAGFATTADALSALIIDTGVPDLGHRKHLLAIGSSYQALNQVGIGVVQNGSGPYGDYYTIDSSTTSDSRSFVTGVVLRDTNHNGRYDPGEGVAGATVSVAGGGSVTTFTSGGYAVLLSPGTYAITVSGAGLAAPLTQNATIGQANVRLNFDFVNVVNPLVGPILVAGTDSGGSPNVRVFDAGTGALVRDFMAYDPRFLGGVRVATGDVNGDGSPDVVTSPGPGGGPDVRVYDGRTGALIREFMAYNPAFTGGVFVALGDVDADGLDDVVTGADAGGGPHVQAFSGRDGSVLRSFMAYDPRFLGGVRVAAADVDGDSFDDVVTGVGPGGGPHVQAFSGRDGSVLHSFMAYNPAFTAGVYVTAGDVNGDGRADLITGAAAGGGPHVQVFSGLDGSVLRSFMAYTPGFTGGVRVGAGDVNGDGKADLITGAGPGGGPHTQVFDSTSLAVLDSFFAYDPGFTGGVFVGGL